ncbi:hypothetical protein SRHO_G00336330 [Serrasalmus rhombeus]
MTGKPTIVETNHQPLVTILKKPIYVAPARLQRLLLRLQSYDITLVYKKGKFIDELTVEDGTIMKGHKAVIPQSLHKEYINIVHKGHPGIEATKRRARSIIFWPNMSINITEELLSWAVCNSTKSHQQKEPLQLHTIPILGSPAERLMSRQTRSAVPVCTKLLEPAPKITQ